jgi:hypothetical protein
MMMRNKGLLLMGLQLAMVLSIAAKYAWERHSSPMVWTRATQYDPQQPLRGRYLALTLHADACGLPTSDHEDRDAVASQFPLRLNHWSWEVRPAAKDGHLVPVLSKDERPGETQTLTLYPNLPCEYASLSGGTEYFIPEHARTPFPLAPGEELWALVTIPVTGPPRPVQLAISDGKQFRALNLR